MSIVYPLSIESFFGRLVPITATMRLTENVRISQTGGGEVLRADAGPRLWEGSIELAPSYHDDAMDLEAVLSDMLEARASFLAYDVRRPGPLADPDGLILGAAVPTIAQISANKREIRIGNLPAGYVISAGDKFGYTYGLDPVRHALHRVLVGGVADGSGVSPWLEVQHFIRPGATVGAELTLLRPSCKAVMVPGSFAGGRAMGMITNQLSFDWRQTLR